MDFTTEDQSGFVEDLIHRELAKTVEERMARALNLGPSRRKKFGGGMFSMELSNSLGRLPGVRWPGEEELRREVTCPHRALEHAVFGLAVWCPDCSEDIFVTHASTEGVSLKGGLADVGRRRKVLGARAAARDVENALEDVVSLFAVAMNFELRRGLEAKGRQAAETEAVFEHGNPRRCCALAVVIRGWEPV